MPQSEAVYTVKDGESGRPAGVPVVIRPAYTLGTGGGMVFTVEELRIVAQRG